MRHDMSKAAIESGPVGPRAGSWEDDIPGDCCSACGGYGYEEHPETLREYECPFCDGSGVASGPVLLWEAESVLPANVAAPDSFAAEARRATKEIPS